MKQYKFLYDQPTEKSISDGASFVFTFPSRSKLTYIKLDLRLYNSYYFSVGLQRPQDFLYFRHSSVNGGQLYSDKANLDKGDTNIVVRVDKVAPTSLKTYINDQYIATIVTQDSRFDKTWIACEPSIMTTDSDKVPIILAVFNDDEHGKAETFAHAMRNPEAGYFEAEKESEIMAATSRLAIAGRDQDLEVRVRALELREKACASARGGDGSDENIPSLGLNVHPPDAEFMKLSATVAWRRASNQVLGSSSLAPIQKRHDTMMSEWVVARGDRLSSNAYDYFVYSHGVIWPKVVLEHTTDINLAKIRKRHAEIMNVLL